MMHTNEELRIAKRRFLVLNQHRLKITCMVMIVVSITSMKPFISVMRVMNEKHYVNRNVKTG